MKEILSIILYLLVLTFLTLLNFSRPKPKPRKRYSCRIVDGQEVDKKYF